MGERKDIKKQIKFIKGKIDETTDSDKIEQLENQINDLKDILPASKINKWIGVGISIATLVSIVLGIVLSLM